MVLFWNLLLYIFTTITYKRLLLLLQCILYFFEFRVKLIKYLVSADTVVSFNLGLDLQQELKYVFFLVSACVQELLSTPKITTF